MGCWVWMIAGQHFNSSFQLDNSMSDSQRVERAWTARATLMAKVRHLLGVRGEDTSLPEGVDFVSCVKDESA